VRTKFNLPSNVSGTIDPQSECNSQHDSIDLTPFTNNELVYVSKLEGNNTKFQCYKIEGLEKWFKTKDELINPLTNLIFPPQSLALKRVQITGKNSNTLENSKISTSFQIKREIQNKICFKLFR